MRGGTPATYSRPLVMGALATGAGTAALLGRSKLLRWGATREEVQGALPGDDLVPASNLTTTRAITIDRSASDVWPWIAQLGQGIGGFYSYDRLENLVGLEIHSADRIVAAWQDVHMGDEVHLAAEVALTVAVAEMPVALVLRGGVAMGGTPSPFDFTWAFVLRQTSEAVTRLVVRERYHYLRGWARLMVEPLAVVSFVMTEKMLRGIRDRAEGVEPALTSRQAHLS
jgi:hypothetical protein